MAVPQLELVAARLRWRCRRGLKELDVLLERYLAQRFLKASAEERSRFAALLELPDPELAALCLGQAPAPDPVTALLIRDISHAPGAELSGDAPVYPHDPAGGRGLGKGP